MEKLERAKEHLTKMQESVKAFGDSLFEVQVNTDSLANLDHEVESLKVMLEHEQFLREAAENAYIGLWKSIPSGGVLEGVRKSLTAISDVPDLTAARAKLERLLAEIAEQK